MIVVKRPETLSFSVPQRFEEAQVSRFVDETIRTCFLKQPTEVIFDFAGLRLIGCTGVSSLSTLFEYLKAQGFRCSIRNCGEPREAMIFMDELGFFKIHGGERQFAGFQAKRMLSPMHQFIGPDFNGYFFYTLMPWIQQALYLTTDQADAISAIFQEIFHNIEYHSKAFGNAVAEYCPRKNILELVASDCGVGIQASLQKLYPERTLTSPMAIQAACEEGVSSKSNVRNRGAGLPSLIKFVTRHTGMVEILSKDGALTASVTAGEIRQVSEMRRWTFPGTQVRVMLRTDGLERLHTDVAPQEFRWD